MKSYILGQRSGGEWGVFIAPPGVDPDTASADQLLLHIANKVDQIILRGTSYNPFSSPVAFGLTYTPFVKLFAGTQSNIYYGNGAASPGYGINRPTPTPYNGATYIANIGPSSMSLGGDSGVSAIAYIVLNHAVTG